MTDTVAGVRYCQGCGKLVDNTQNFCSSCGSRLEVIADERENLHQYLTPSLTYYFICVILIGVYSLTDVWDESFKHSVVVDAIFAVLTLIFAIYSWRGLGKLYNAGSLKVAVLSAVVIASVASALVVNAVAGFLNSALYDYEIFETAVYWESSNPFLFAVLFIGLQPALFEEMAFRGFLFNNFAKLMNKRTTLIATSILFAALHFSLIGLLWLIPIGLALGWLRLRFQTVWYSMLAHFCYNTTIVFIEFM